MCGVAGFLTTGGFSTDDASIARAMGDALRHRGPDDRREWVDPSAGIALSHRRLSIVDLSAAGRQPMQTADGRFRWFHADGQKTVVEGDSIENAIQVARIIWGDVQLMHG